MKRSRWFGWSRSAGRWGFMLHRMTGLALTAYLGVHLLLLGQLRAGPEAWDEFVGLMSSPFVLVLDTLLLGAIVFHGLNGLRVTMLGLGQAVRWQKALLGVSMALASVITIWVGIKMLFG